jgi:hypothetical protein
MSPPIVRPVFTLVLPIAGAIAFAFAGDRRRLQRCSPRRWSPLRSEPLDESPLWAGTSIYTMWPASCERDALKGKMST